MRRFLEAVPVIAVAYVLIVGPLIGKAIPGENGFRVFWPALACMTIVAAIACRRQLNFNVFQSPPLVILAIFLILAGASVSWAYSPDHAATRWLLQVMALTTFIVPFALAERRVDLIQRLHYFFLMAMVISAWFVLNTPPLLAYTGDVLGHAGYFYHKQYLGMYASLTIMLALHELTFPNHRRVLAIISICLSVWLLFMSQSKSALGFSFIAMGIAATGLMISIKSKMRLATVFLLFPLAYFSADLLISNLPYRIAYRLTGDPTFTGRTVIWEFIESQIARAPWFGWGFHSYWDVGPGSPALRWAPGFVKNMPSSHSGYMDVELEMGRVGLIIFLLFIFATFFALESMKKQGLMKTWLYLSVAVYAVITNCLDTSWLVIYDPAWLMFVLVGAEAARVGALQPVAATVSRPVQQRGARLSMSTDPVLSQ